MSGKKQDTVPAAPRALLLLWNLRPRVSRQVYGRFEAALDKSGCVQRLSED